MVQECVNSYKVGSETMETKRGFTLVELLVVIAVIALLMSILMPALSKTRRQAKDVLCQANLKQWGSVFGMYADDNGGHFMPGFTDDERGYQWPEALRPYYPESADLRLCPVSAKPASECKEGYIWPQAEPQAWGVFPKGVEFWCATPGDYGSYGINAWVGDPPEDAHPYPGFEHVFWRGPVVRGAANIPLFADCVWIDTWPVVTEETLDAYELVYAGCRHDNSMGRLCVKRHGIRINMLFLDYRVTGVELTEMWSLTWHRGYRASLAPTSFPRWMTVP